MSKAEGAFLQEDLDNAFSKGHQDSLFDFFAPKDYLPEFSRRIAASNIRKEDFDPEFFGTGKEYQITYNFSSGIRNNVFPVLKAFSGGAATGEYGAKGWSFRMLYEFLCENYNGNVPFIDTYFDRVWKSRPVYREFKEVWDDIHENIAAEQMDTLSGAPFKADGTLDKRSRQYRKAFKDFKVWQDPIVKTRCKALADNIRKDIETCLRSGKLPLRGKEGATVAKVTEKVRSQFAGMAHPDRLFYASGRLIRHLNIFVAVGEAA